MATSPRATIIVAGGSGLRMGADIPKQFLLLNRLPVLAQTLRVFHNFDAEMRLIVVLPEDHFSHWQALCKKHNIDVPHELVEGGEQRFHSVQNGLKMLSDETLVAVHDGVRPLVSKDTIERCFAAAAKHGAAIPVIEVSDTLRHKTESSSAWVNRSDYVRVQTPQCFKTDVIVRAYQQDFSDNFTDDASVVEKSGHEVDLVAGNNENLKITSPADLHLAEALMAQQ